MLGSILENVLVAQAAAATYHRQMAQQQECTSQSSGGWKAKMEVLADLVLAEGGPSSRLIPPCCVFKQQRGSSGISSPSHQGTDPLVQAPPS